MFDSLTASYSIAFYARAVIMVAVTVAMHFIISIAGNVKKEVAAKEGA